MLRRCTFALLTLAPIAGCDPAVGDAHAPEVADRLAAVDPAAPTVKLYSAEGHLVDKGKLVDGQGPPDPWFWYSLPFVMFNVEVNGERIDVFDPDGNGIGTGTSSPVFFTDGQGRDFILTVEF